MYIFIYVQGIKKNISKANIFVLRNYNVGFFPYKEGYYPFIVKEGDPAAGWDNHGQPGNQVDTKS